MTLKSCLMKEISLYDFNHNYIGSCTQNNAGLLLQEQRKSKMGLEQNQEIEAICKNLHSQLTKNKNLFPPDMYDKIYKELDYIVNEIVNLEKGEEK